MSQEGLWLQDSTTSHHFSWYSTPPSPIQLCLFYFPISRYGHPPEGRGCVAVVISGGATPPAPFSMSMPPATAFRRAPPLTTMMAAAPPMACPRPMRDGLEFVPDEGPILPYNVRMCHVVIRRSVESCGVLCELLVLS